MLPAGMAPNGAGLATRPGVGAWRCGPSLMPESRDTCGARALMPVGGINPGPGRPRSRRPRHVRRAADDAHGSADAARGR